MRINHNIAALNTHRQLTNNTAGASKSLEKLSSGFRINRAGDDAAGLAISEKMRGQIRGLEMAMKNSQDSISLIQTAEGAMNEVHSILQRMRELAVQAVNDTNTTSDRQELQKEINQLTSEINRIGNTTEFNEKKLLNGDLSASFRTGVVSGTSTFLGSGVKATAQVVNVGDEPISWSTGSSADIDIKFSGVAANGFDWDTVHFSGGSIDAPKLVITRNGDDFTISFSGVDLSGNSLQINAEQLAINGSGNYTYGNHGIYIEFSADDIATWESGGSVTIDLQYAGTVAGSGVNIDNSINTVPTNQAWAAGSDLSGVGGVGASGIVIASGANLGGVLNNVDQVRIAYDGTNGTLTVQLLSNGSGVSTNTMSWSGGQSGTVNIDGLAFHFIGTETEFSGTFNLETEGYADYLTTSGSSGTLVDNSLVFQTGSNENQTTTLAVEDVRALALGIVSTTANASGFSSGANVTKGTDGVAIEYALDITTSANAAKAITTLDAAIKTVSSERSKLGAVQNRLEHTINNLGTSAENLTAAESRIRDVDMAKEMMAFTKDNILTQAAQAMLAQANQQPQGVLQLLR